MQIQQQPQPVPQQQQEQQQHVHQQNTQHQEQLQQQQIQQQQQRQEQQVQVPLQSMIPQQGGLHTARDQQQMQIQPQRQDVLHLPSQPQGFLFLPPAQQPQHPQQPSTQELLFTLAAFIMNQPEVNATKVPVDRNRAMRALLDLVHRVARLDAK